MISLIRFARLIRPRPPNSAFGLRQWLLRGLPSANLISGNQANLRSREAFSLSWLCRTGILSCVLLYRLSKTVCFLESSLPIHRRTRPSPHSDDSGNFHGPVCAGSTRRSHCLSPARGEFGGRVRISRASGPENFRVSEKGKASFSVHYIFMKHYNYYT